MKRELLNKIQWLTILFRLFFSFFFVFLFYCIKNMPAHESNKAIILEHPSGSKAEVALFGT